MVSEQSGGDVQQKQMKAQAKGGPGALWRQKQNKIKCENAKGYRWGSNPGPYIPMP